MYIYHFVCISPRLFVWRSISSSAVSPSSAYNQQKRNRRKYIYRLRHHTKVIQIKWFNVDMDESGFPSYPLTGWPGEHCLQLLGSKPNNHSTKKKWYKDSIQKCFGRGCNNIFAVCPSIFYPIMYYFFFVSPVRLVDFASSHYYEDWMNAWIWSGALQAVDCFFTTVYFLLFFRYRTGAQPTSLQQKII